MRKRSLSVAYDRGLQFEQMANKFEGVPSEHEQESESEEENDEVLNESDWTGAEYQALMDGLRKLLPRKDNKSYKVGLSKIDWESVVIDGRTADDVKATTEGLIRKIRKYRTLSEMINDIPSITKKDKLKKPLTAYNFYMRDRYPQLKEKHPEMQSKAIFVLVQKEYRILSEKKKKKYEAMATDAKELFKQQKEKYYRDHPEESKKAKSKISAKLPKKNMFTPFDLFRKDKQTECLSLAELRAQWNQLEIKKKLNYIQQAFKSQTENPAISLKLTKEEQFMIAHAKGKPVSIAGSTSEYYLKNYAESLDSVSLAEWRKLKLLEFKKLPKVRKLELEIEYRQAKQDYVTKYENYITSITDKKTQQAEIDQLKSFIDKKMDKDDRQQLPDENRTFCSMVQTSQLENEMLELPIAESTLVTTKTKKANNSAQQKNFPITGSPKPLKSILKSPVKKDAQPAAQTFTKPAVPKSKRKHSLSENDSDSNSEKKSKRSTTYASIVEPGMGSMENGNTSAVGNAVQEPVRPPSDVIKYYMLNHYLGKKKNCAESFKKLSVNQQEAMKEEMRLAQRKYFKQLQKFLKTVPPKDIKKYIKKLKQAQVDFDIGNSVLDDSGVLSESVAKKTPKQEPQTSTSSSSSGSEDDSADEKSKNDQGSGTEDEESSEEE
ncbi:nucleolar transcription factor 1-like [Anopheles marshallii]|uniref:nucleolar transcription factor 1-like n=1 Tax=Anopheles marshallii TaxID=1521116 RepID=UPI00237BB3EB|nr:nucleolar transcription factor 1-like [Anopheles marshallii]